MRRQLRWTEHAVTQLGAIAEYLGLASPIYAEQVVDRVVRRLEQAIAYPESGRMVPELAQAEVRELIEPPYRLIYRVDAEGISSSRSCTADRSSAASQRAGHVERPANVALQLTSDAKESRLLATLAGAYYYGSLAAELWR